VKKFPRIWNPKFHCSGYKSLILYSTNHLAKFLHFSFNIRFFSPPKHPHWLCMPNSFKMTKYRNSSWKIKQSASDADDPSPSGIKVKNEWSRFFTLLCAFRCWRLMKHKHDLRFNWIHLDFQVDFPLHNLIKIPYVFFTSPVCVT
jgi:hypothetical protein